MNKIHEIYLEKAIDLAFNNALDHGGPFGAIIVKGDEIISTGVNRVTDNCDPTAHAEVMAIRKACKALHTFDLSGCTLYTSCEPCPMCLGAIYWSRLDSVYYAANRVDAANINFDDEFIYKEVPLSPEKRSLPFTQLSLPSALKPFKAWANNNEKTPY